MKASEVNGEEVKSTGKERRRRVHHRRPLVDAAWGALSGALAGVIGVLLFAWLSPPILLSIGVLAVAGAIFGYRYGDRVHAALWEALFRW